MHTYTIHINTQKPSDIFVLQPSCSSLFCSETAWERTVLSYYCKTYSTHPWTNLSPSATILISVQLKENRSGRVCVGCCCVSVDCGWSCRLWAIAGQPLLCFNQ